MSPCSSLRLRNTCSSVMVHCSCTGDNHCTIEPARVLRRKCWSKSLSCICFRLNLQDHPQLSRSVFVSSILSCLCFSPPSHPLFFKKPEISNQMSFLFMWSFFFLFLLNFLTDDSFVKMFRSSKSSFFVLFSSRWTQFKLSVLIISLSFV